MSARLDFLTEIISRLGRRFTTRDLQRAYQLTFMTPSGKNFVLPDLCEFCHGQEPAPRNADMFEQGRAAGRRDVWLRINEHIHLTQEELVAVYAHRLSLSAQDFNR